MAGHVNILKLSVGTKSVEGLAKWQKRPQVRTADGHPRHVTRMWPRREAEIVAGGSIYWVIKGVVLCRQRILRLEEVVRADGIRRCGLVLDPELVPTAAQPRKAFQGWRYLVPADAPRDLPAGAAAETALPPKLAAALSEIGVL
ncbi:hypothetical protein BCF33_1481 [Hasllibacter halocynthiae]|uniref:DUF1489 family protein n=1 Tax=Hasllibacter halocynthiae TaxID=595589 RepID=A0A2T0X119_9RHOB|nr:DUF1489 domain-containing protein [Hasllibacter halocynthiae]PRY92630.1 hypothetical protein BCF33_1481 [Hasllibacter halocynthiae]